MTFRELAMQDDAAMGPFMNVKEDRNLFQTILFNQSPVMKLWFMVMLINLGVFLLINH